MTTYGSDFSGIDDIDALWSFETNELRAFQQALARRLMCPAGGLFYDPTYGYDVRQLVADFNDPDAAARSIDAELKKDERTGSSTTTVTQLDNETLLIQSQIVPADPNLVPFSLTLQVTQVTVQLLES